jgi:hypothetical protein
MRGILLKMLILAAMLAFSDPLADAALIRGSVYVPRNKIRGGVKYRLANMRAVAVTGSIFESMGRANTALQFGISIAKIAIMVSPLLAR